MIRAPTLPDDMDEIGDNARARSLVIGNRLQVLQEKRGQLGYLRKIAHAHGRTHAGRRTGRQAGGHVYTVTGK